MKKLIYIIFALLLVSNAYGFNCYYQKHFYHGSTNGGACTAIDYDGVWGAQYTAAWGDCYEANWL